MQSKGPSSWSLSMHYAMCGGGRGTRGGGLENHILQYFIICIWPELEPSQMPAQPKNKPSCRKLALPLRLVFLKGKYKEPNAPLQTRSGLAVTDGGRKQLISNDVCLYQLFCQKILQADNDWSIGISTNWFKNQLCPSLRLLHCGLRKRVLCRIFLI
jgi:hypothetical protein